VRKQKMKQWMKKRLAACLALVMCLTLAACGGEEGETPAGGAGTIPVATAPASQGFGCPRLFTQYRSDLGHDRATTNGAEQSV